MQRFLGVLALLSLTAFAADAAVGAPIEHGIPTPGTSPTNHIAILPNQPYSNPPTRAHVFDAYLPLDGADMHPAVILIHGGSWRRGNKRDLHKQGEYFARRGIASFSINYRLAPRFVWPAQLEDAQAAVKWIRAHADQYGVDPGRIGVFGASAGGQMAAMLAMLTNGNPYEGSGVAAAVTWSAPMDLVLLGELNGNTNDRARGFLGCSDGEECVAAYEASPINFVGRHDAPLFFVHSRWEPQPVQGAREMDQRMREKHAAHVYVELPGDKHATGYGRDDIPHSPDTVIEASLNFFLTHL
ncbi:MAG TPA: alpha/beta hydrolase [Actinomycetota bacterium]|nr:alpha/beta hydrolase [Actinomycetota bacterium]